VWKGIVVVDEVDVCERKTKAQGVPLNTSALARNHMLTFKHVE